MICVSGAWKLHLNSQNSAYALDFFNNNRECGSIDETIESLKTWTKGSKMNCFLYKSTDSRSILIEEQKVDDFNPIYTLANVTGRHQDHITKTGSLSQLDSQQYFLQETS